MSEHLLTTQRSPFKCFATSPKIIRRAVLRDLWFPLSLRDVEDPLHERGIDVSHETVRFYGHRFGPMVAAEIRMRRIEGFRSSRWRWQLDEAFVKTNGEMHYLRRAVDHEGEFLESLVTNKRDKKVALEFRRKATRKHGQPDVIVTCRLRPYDAALKEIGAVDRQETGRWPKKGRRILTCHSDDKREQCSGSGGCEISRSLLPCTPPSQTIPTTSAVSQAEIPSS